MVDTLATTSQRDYYYRDGMPYRPAPRRDEPSWRHLREFLYGPWMSIPERWETTDQTALIDDHMWEGDEVMDGVVQMFLRISPTRGRALLEAALSDGIDAVPDAPPELVTLFDQLHRVPEWYSQEVGERGRLRLCRASDSGKNAVGAFGVFATSMEEDVSASVGATGRIVRTPVQRSIETSKFFEEVTYREALTPGSEVFKTIVRVRMMHSLVRRGLRSRWGDDVFAEHGMPISNTNMAAGSAWFGSMSVLFDHAMGRPVTLAELDDITVHWGYILYLFGVNERLIPKTGTEAIHLANHVLASAGAPSQWRVELVEALLHPMVADGTETGEQLARFFLGAAAFVLGPSEVEALIVDTRYEGTDLARYAEAFRAQAATDVELCRMQDVDPELRRASERASKDADPWWRARGDAIRARTAGTGLQTPFAHHDASATGEQFASPGT